MILKYKNNMMLLKRFSVFAFAALAFSQLSSCKKDFDEPPADGVDPDITVNANISVIKALFYQPGTITRIDSDYVFEAIVVGDDHSGNIYKTMIVQDSTSAISMEVDMSSFYTNYKIGRRIYVKCKGLYISDYNGLVQLGGYIDNSSVPPSLGRIPQSLLDNYILKGKWNQDYDTLVTNNVNNLDLSLDQNKLVTLTGVKFASGNTCVTYADMLGQTSANRTMQDASGNQFFLRSSNFADFGSMLTPTGTGSITGIFQIYQTDRQFVIRDINDVQITGVCQTCTINTSDTSGTYINLDKMRCLFNSGVLTIPAGKKIKGTVISDLTTNNINSRNVIIQDASGGILVRFASNNTFALGDQIEVAVGGLSFYNYNGLLEVDNTPNANATITTGLPAVVPRSATIDQINNNGDAWQSTLVKITGATLSGNSGTYGTTTMVNQGSSSVLLYTGSGATFSGQTYPTTTVSVTAIVGSFNSVQLGIRNTSDVQ